MKAEVMKRTEAPPTLILEAETEEDRKQLQAFKVSLLNEQFRFPSVVAGDVSGVLPIVYSACDCSRCGIFRRWTCEYRRYFTAPHLGR